MPDDTPTVGPSVSVEFTDAELDQFLDKPVPGTVTCGTCGHRHRVLMPLGGGRLDITCQGCGGRLTATIVGRVDRKPGT